MVIWVVNWAGGCWGLQVQKLLLASLSHRCTYLHNRSCGPCSFVQWTHAHLLKHGIKCRLCWQVGMGVCRRGAGPNAGSTFVHTSRTPETGREAQAIPAVQVTSGCLQSFRWTPATSSCAPVPLWSVQSRHSWALFSLGARESRRAQNPGLLDLFGAGSHLGAPATAPLTRACSSGEWQLYRYHADHRWLPRVFPRPEMLALPESGAGVPGSTCCPHPGHSLQPSVLINLRDKQKDSFHAIRSPFRL